jgi:sigma-B regulation protein RsbU (phosphoserine phosphatase)
MPGLSIQVHEGERLVHSAECPGAVEMGRQAENEGAPYLTRQEGNRWRVVIARLEEVVVSRRCLTAEPLGAGRVRLTNLGRVPLIVLGGNPLNPGGSREVSMPVFLSVGDKKIGILSADPASLPPPTAPQAAPRQEAVRQPVFRLLDGDAKTPLQTLAQATLPPGSGSGMRRPRLLPSAAPGEPNSEMMIRWLQASMDVLQSAANTSDFFDKAATALVDLVGLDTGQILLLRDGAWRLQAQRVTDRTRQTEERQASRHVLNRLVAEKRTFWQVPADAGPQGSLMGLSAVVASPLLDKSGAVIGALYGDRQAPPLSPPSKGGDKGGAGLPPITQLEALLVELLACGVAAGVARIEQEQAELQRQKKFLLYERELQIGRTIQVGFLPETLPQFAGWEVVPHFQPARDVAGDFYDVFPLADRVALVMADVCDKGLGAALFMALFRSLIRAFCRETPWVVLMGVAARESAYQPGGAALPASHRRAALFGDLIALLAVELTNKYVTTNHANAYMFATLFLGILDPATGDLTYVNAGHDPPTIIGPRGIQARLESTGPAVGFMPEATFDLGKVRLEPGEMLVMHTDGVTDARSPAGQAFSEKRLLSILDEKIPTAGALIDRLVSELRSHVGDGDQFDDITLLALRRQL